MTFIHCDRCGAVIGAESEVSPIHIVYIKNKANYLDLRASAKEHAELCDKCYCDVRAFIGFHPKIKEDVQDEG